MAVTSVISRSTSARCPLAMASMARLVAVIGDREQIAHGIEAEPQATRPSDEGQSPVRRVNEEP